MSAPESFARSFARLLIGMMCMSGMAGIWFISA